MNNIQNRNNLKSRIHIIDNSISMINNYSRLLDLINNIIRLKQSGFKIKFFVDFFEVYSYLFPSNIDYKHLALPGEKDEESFIRLNLSLNILFKTSNFKLLMLPPHIIEFNHKLDLIKRNLLTFEYKKTFYKRLNQKINSDPHNYIKALKDISSLEKITETEIDEILPMIQKYFPEIVILCNHGVFEPRNEILNFIKNNIIDLKESKVFNYTKLDRQKLKIRSKDSFDSLELLRYDMYESNKRDAFAISLLVQLNEYNIESKSSNTLYFFTSHSKPTLDVLNTFPLQVDNNDFDIGIPIDFFPVYMSHHNNNLEVFLENIKESKQIFNKFFIDYNTIKSYFERDPRYLNSVEISSLESRIFSTFDELWSRVSQVYNLQLAGNSAPFLEQLLASRGNDNFIISGHLSDSLIKLFKREEFNFIDVFEKRISSLEIEIDNYQNLLKEYIELSSTDLSGLKDIEEKKFKISRVIPYTIKFTDLFFNDLMAEIDKNYDRHYTKLLALLADIIESANLRDNPNYNLLLSYIKGILNKWDMALEEIDKGIMKSTSNKNEYYFLKGVLYRLGKKDFINAFHFCQKAIKAKDNEAKYYKELGVIIYYAINNRCDIPEASEYDIKIDIQTVINMQLKALELVDEKQELDLLQDIYNNLTFVLIERNNKGDLEKAGKYIEQYKIYAGDDPFTGKWSPAFLHTYATYLEKVDYIKYRSKCIKLCEHAINSRGLIPSHKYIVRATLKIYKKRTT